MNNVDYELVTIGASARYAKHYFKTWAIQDTIGRDMGKHQSSVTKFFKQFKKAGYLEWPLHNISVRRPRNYQSRTKWEYTKPGKYPRLSLEPFFQCMRLQYRLKLSANEKTQLTNIFEIQALRDFVSEGEGTIIKNIVVVLSQLLSCHYGRFLERLIINHYAETVSVKASVNGVAKKMESLNNNVESLWRALKPDVKKQITKTDLAVVLLNRVSFDHTSKYHKLFSEPLIRKITRHYLRSNQMLTRLEETKDTYPTIWSTDISYEQIKQLDEKLEKKYGLDIAKKQYDYPFIHRKIESDSERYNCLYKKFLLDNWRMLKEKEKFIQNQYANFTYKELLHTKHPNLLQHIKIEKEFIVSQFKSSFIDLDVDEDLKVAVHEHQRNLLQSGYN